MRDGHEENLRLVLGAHWKIGGAFFAAVFLLAVASLWTARGWWRRKREVEEEQKQDLIVFVAGSLFFLLVVLPAVESFFYSQPYASTYNAQAASRAGMVTHNIETPAKPAFYASYVTDLDLLIGAVLCSLVGVLSLMVWPRACDTCEN